MRNEEQAKQLMLLRYAEIKQDIATAEPEQSCELGAAIKTLALLLCDTHIYNLQREDTDLTLKGFLFGIAKSSPMAGAIVFASFVVGRIFGVF